MPLNNLRFFLGEEPEEEPKRLSTNTTLKEPNEFLQLLLGTQQRQPIVDEPAVADATKVRKVDLSPRSEKMRQDLKNISKLSKENKFVDPKLDIPNLGTALDVIGAITGEKPAIWENIPEDIQGRIQSNRALFKMPSGRALDPVTHKALGLLFSPAQSFVSGIQSGADKIQEGIEAIQDGDVAGGGLAIVAGLTGAGFGAITPFIPVLAGFSIANKVAEDVGLGEEANLVMSPFSSGFRDPIEDEMKRLQKLGATPEEISDKLGVTLSEAKTKKSIVKENALELGDLIYNLVLFGKTHKGIKSVGKKIGESKLKIEEQAPKETLQEKKLIGGKTPVIIKSDKGTLTAFKNERGNFQVKSIGVSERGKGHGKKLYNDLIDRAIKEDVKKIESDRALSDEALNVYKKLGAEGFDITLNPKIKTTKLGDRTIHTVPKESKAGVVEIDLTMEIKEKGAVEKPTAKVEKPDIENITKVKTFTTEEGKFSVYDIDKEHRRADMFTVQESKDGFIVRNVFVPEKMQKQGIATEFYKKLNKESLKKTGNPLRSTQPRKLESGETVHELNPSGIKLWDRLVEQGVAEKLGEKNYRFKQPTLKTERVLKETLGKDEVTDTQKLNDWINKNKETSENLRTKANDNLLQSRFDFGLFDKKTWESIAVTGKALARGVKDFGGWAKKMVVKFGDGIRPALRNLWQMVKQMPNVFKKKEIGKIVQPEAKQPYEMTKKEFGGIVKPELTQLDLIKKYVDETGEKINTEMDLQKVQKRFPKEWVEIERLEKLKDNIYQGIPEKQRRGFKKNQLDITTHKNFVGEAIREGKEIPAEVLKDYPELQKLKEPVEKPIKEVKPKEEIEKPIVEKPIVEKPIVEKPIRESRLEEQQRILKQDKFTEDDLGSLNKGQLEDIALKNNLIEERGITDYNKLTKKILDNQGKGKMRKFGKRVSEEPLFKEISEEIKQDPESYYEPQKRSGVRDEISSLTDKELNQRFEQFIEGIKEIDNTGVMAGLEKITRQIAKGEDPFETVQKLNKSGTPLGQLISQYADLKTASPKAMLELLKGRFTEKGRVLPERLESNLEILVDKFVKSNAKTKDFERILETEPTLQNIKALRKLRDKSTKDEFNLVRFMDRFLPRRVSDIFSTSIKGSLMGTVSLIKNPLWNLFGEFLPRELGKLLIAPADYLHTKITGKPRTHLIGGKYYYELFKGGVEGLKEATKVMVSGKNEFLSEKYEISRGFQPFRAWVDLFSKDMPKDIKTGKVPLRDRFAKLLEGTIGIYPEGIFRALPFGDLPFQRGKLRSGLVELGELKGLGGEELTKFVEEPLIGKGDVGGISKETMILEAERSVFMQSNRLSNGLMGAINYLKDVPVVGGAARVLFTANIPFFKIPTNALFLMADYSLPIIPLTKSLYWSKLANKGGELSSLYRRQAYTEMSKAVIGTTMYTAAGWLVSNNITSGGISSDRKERGIEYKTKPPRTINLTRLEKLLRGEKLTENWSSDDRVVDYETLGGMGVVLMIMTDYFENNKTEKHSTLSAVVDFTSRALFGGAKFLANQSIAQGVQGFLGTILGDNEKVREKYLDNMSRVLIAPLLPNQLDAINRVHQEFIIDRKGDEPTETFLNVIEQKNPLGTPENPSYIRDIWGRPVKRPPDLLGKASNIFYLFKTRVLEDDPATFEIYDIYTRTNNSAVIPSQVSNSFTFNNQTVKLRKDLHEKFQSTIGSIRLQTLKNFMQSDGYTNLSDEKKIEKIKKIYSGSYNLGKKMFINFLIKQKGK